MKLSNYGKSTLFNVHTGVVAKDSGEISLKVDVQNVFWSGEK
jgi:ABC-type branched-subunit amino acid transport system ATPase component